MRGGHGHLLQMVALTDVRDGELWRSFPEATRNDNLGLLSTLLERVAVWAGLAAGRGRPDLAAAAGTRRFRLRPGPAPVPAGRAGEPAGGPPARARVGSRAGRAGPSRRRIRAVPAGPPGPALGR